MRLLIASQNNDKIEEMKDLLAGLPVEVVPLSHYPGAPEVKEDRDTFEGNA
ncbi:MAG: non-canonical purine NTP pyrophosphatase, partial [Candidatus Brocadiia bacterium]